MREPRPHEKLKRIGRCIGRWFVFERSEELCAVRRKPPPWDKRPVPVFWYSYRIEPRPHEKLKRIGCCIGRWVVHEKSFELTKLFSVNLGRNRHTFWDVGFSLFRVLFRAHHYRSVRNSPSSATLFAKRKVQKQKARFLLLRKIIGGAGFTLSELSRKYATI